MLKGFTNLDPRIRDDLTLLVFAVYGSERPVIAYIMGISVWHYRAFRVFFKAAVLGCWRFGGGWKYITFPITSPPRPFFWGGGLRFAILIHTGWLSCMARQIHKTEPNIVPHSTNQAHRLPTTVHEPQTIINNLLYNYSFHLQNHI